MRPSYANKITIRKGTKKPSKNGEQKDEDASPFFCNQGMQFTYVKGEAERH